MCTHNLKINNFQQGEGFGSFTTLKPSANHTPHTTHTMDTQNTPSTSGLKRQAEPVSSFKIAKRMTRKPTTKLNLANFILNKKQINHMYTVRDVEYSVKTENRYTPIQTEQTDESSMDADETNTNQETNETDETRTKVSLPVIFVYTNMHKELTNFIKTNCKHTTIKHNVEYSTIKTNTKADRDAVVHFLTEKKIEHFTHSDNKDKPAKILIKYLPLAYTPDEVKKDLHDQGIVADKVTRFLKFNNNVKTESNMLIANINKNHQEKAYNINNICGNTVRIEPFVKTKKAIPQCHNCLNYGHSSATCRMLTKCVKCSQNHNIENCPNLNAKSVCANCNQEHKASYRGCTYYKTLKMHTNKKTNTQTAEFHLKKSDFPSLPGSRTLPVTQQNQNFTSSVTTPASRTQPASHQQQNFLSPENQNLSTNAWGPKQANQSTMGNITEIGQLLKEANIGHLLEIVKNMLIKCKFAKTDAEKAMIIMEELSKLN